MRKILVAVFGILLFSFLAFLKGDMLLVIGSLFGIIAIGAIGLNDKVPSPKGERGKIITWIDKEHYNLLCEIASRTGITVGTLINRAISRFLCELELDEDREHFPGDLEFIRQRTINLRQKKDKSES